MLYTQDILTLRSALAAFRQKQSTASQFCETWRAQSALIAALPARYQQVSEDLLARLESASLFGEESCSFSPEDLLAHLDNWLNKAEQTLATHAN
jgi:hypothetical protein